VFAAPAVSRHLQDATGTSISKLVRTLRAVRSATTIRVNGHEITLDPDIPATAQPILDQLSPTSHRTAARVRSGRAFFRA
jgi:hypothetical protein